MLIKNPALAQVIKLLKRSSGFIEVVFIHPFLVMSSI